MDEIQMRTWAEIDLAALAHNYRALRGMLPAGCRFMGMVKANAYGHGALPVARTLEALGVDYLAVASLTEAEELREGGVQAPILILGPTAPGYVPRLLELRVTQTVCDKRTGEAYSREAEKLGRRLRVHVKADTGMGRLGFVGESRVADILALGSLKGLELEGAFTHFSDADGSEDYTMAQLTDFLDLLDKLREKGLVFPIRHCAASAAMLHYPCTHLDMVRPGIALYGCYPDEGSVGLDGPGLVPVMTLKTRVAAVRTLPAGSAVGYNRTHILSRESRLAVLPIGYGDGFPRGLSNRARFLFPQGTADLVGRVCMDLSMADVTDLPGVKPGDEVTIFGPALPVEEKAEAMGTISYELLTGVGPRVPRVYRHGEEPESIQ